MNISKNTNGQIFKVTTSKNLSFEDVLLLAEKHNLNVTDHDGDFLTLTFPYINQGAHVSNISDPSSFNNWSLTPGISADQLSSIQPFFEELASI